jgi:hypothetical protein
VRLAKSPQLQTEELIRVWLQCAVRFYKKPAAVLLQRLPLVTKTFTINSTSIVLWLAIEFSRFSRLVLLPGEVLT